MIYASQAICKLLNREGFNMAYNKSYKNYANQKSYNTGVKVGSFFTGIFNTNKEIEAYNERLEKAKDKRRKKRKQAEEDMINKNIGVESRNDEGRDKGRR